MSNAEVVIKWAFDNVFNGSTKITKAIHTALKSTILVLAGLEVSQSGSMHALTKFSLLRDKILEQADAFIKTHIAGNGVPTQLFVTTKLLRSADISMKKEWKISTTAETTWRSYMNVFC